MSDTIRNVSAIAKAFGAHRDRIDGLLGTLGFVRTKQPPSGIPSHSVRMEKTEVTIKTKWDRFPQWLTDFDLYTENFKRKYPGGYYCCVYIQAQSGLPMGSIMNSWEQTHDREIHVTKEQLLARKNTYTFKVLPLP